MTPDVVAGLQQGKEVMAFLFGGAMVVRAAWEAKPLWNAGAQRDWEDTAREEIRIRHALRHHADVGSEFREIVTDRADRIASRLTVALVAWLLLAVCASGLAVLHGDPLVRIGALAGGVLAACALVSFYRRGRWAVRWLDDPLPRP